MSSPQTAGARKNSTVAARISSAIPFIAAVLMVFAFSVAEESRAEIVDGKCIYSHNGKEYADTVPFSDSDMFDIVLGRGEFRLITRLQCAADSQSNFNAVQDGSPLLVYYLARENLGNNQVEAARLMIKGGANTGATNDRGDTVLHAAANNSHAAYELVPLLIRQGANVNAKNSQSDTALHIAAREGNNPIYNALIDNRATDLNASGNGGDKALILAVHNSHIGYSPLIQAGADVNVRDGDGNAALHYAAGAGQYPNTELANDLLAANANVNIGDSNGDTPLIVAVANCNLDIARLLLDAGANANSTNNSGEKAANFGVGCEDEVTALLGEPGLLYEEIVEAACEKLRLLVDECSSKREGEIITDMKLHGAGGLYDDEGVFYYDLQTGLLTHGTFKHAHKDNDGKFYRDIERVEFLNGELHRGYIESIDSNTSGEVYYEDGFWKKAIFTHSGGGFEMTMDDANGNGSYFFKGINGMCAYGTVRNWDFHQDKAEEC